MSKISLSIYRSNVIRGLAIIAVVLIHVLAYFKGIYNHDYQLFFIAIDQLSRFCVPAFLIISGYGLATKYEDKKISYFSFLKKRIGKLLPLYLIWSFSSILIIKSVPEWSFDNQPMSITIQLLMGQADYQLYFLPVLFQLYALFPLIWFFRKKPNLLLLGAFLIQTIFYIFYTSKLRNTDRLEYVVFISWIVYFVFGIYLKIKELPKTLIKLALPATILVFAWIVFSSLTQINSGVDPLPALKFTRLIIIPFGLLINLSLITIVLPTQNFLIKTKFNFLAWLGKNSYVIFLSHTIGLRIIYAAVTKQLEPSVLLSVIVAWLLIIILTLKMLQEKKTKAMIPR